MSSGGPTTRMYRDKKTTMKRVRSIGRQTFSNPARLVKRVVEPPASLANGDGAGLAAQHSLSNVARLFAGVSVLADHVQNLFDFTEPEFDGNLLVIAVNPQSQRIAGLLFLEPPIRPLGYFTTIPVNDAISGLQTCSGSGAFRINSAHDELAVRFVLHKKTKRRSAAFHGAQSQTCQCKNLLIRKWFRARYVFLEKVLK